VSAVSAVSAPIMQRLVNLCGKTELIEAFAWIAASRCVVSNDSGLMHAAAAFDVPVAAIFGSTDPHHTPPHSPKAQIFSLRLSCSPCFKRVCPLGTTACLKELSAAPVIAFIKEKSAAGPLLQ
jgi:heptosyltransferase II